MPACPSNVTMAPSSLLTSITATCASCGMTIAWMVMARGQMVILVLTARHRSEERSPPRIHDEDRNGTAFDGTGRCRYGAVPAEDHQHVGERGEVLLERGGGFPDELGGGGIEQRVLAPSPQPRDKLLQEGLGLGGLCLDDDADALHGRHCSPGCL